MSARAESYRLSKRGEAGLACDLQGVALGPVVLVEKTGEGVLAQYRRRPLGEIEKALKLAYGKASATELAGTLTGLDAAAQALNRRRLSDATLAASRMRLQPLSPQAVTKLLAAPGFCQVPLAKAFNPDQPRVPAGNPNGGQWGDGEGGTVVQPVSTIRPALSAGASVRTAASTQPVTPSGVQYAANILGATMTDASPGRDSSSDWGNIQPPSRLRADQIQNWKNFKEALTNADQLTDNQRQAFLGIFGIEGGMHPDPTSSAVAGLLQDDVRKAVNAGYILGIPANTAPEDLTPQQIISGYEFELDSSLDRVNGIEALNQFQDPQTAAAVADTLFRQGRTGGAEILVDAANTVLDRLSESMKLSLGINLPDLPTPNSVGPQTLATLADLSNGGLGMDLRDELAELRAEKNQGPHYKSEKVRADYFR